MKAARYTFCQAYKDWTLEDWKNVIWIDETSVILGHYQGGVYIGNRKQQEKKNMQIKFLNSLMLN